MRHYDNERLNKKLKKSLPYRRQRRKAQGFRYSTGELEAKKQSKQCNTSRQEPIEFVDDTEQETI